MGVVVGVKTSLEASRGSRRDWAPILWVMADAVNSVVLMPWGGVAAGVMAEGAILESFP